MHRLSIFLSCAAAAAFFTKVPIFAATSLLWGTNGELWNNTYPSNSISGRITDCSHAGYQGGDVPIPFYPVAVVVTNYGAIPNDGLDDSAAIQAAINACPTNGRAIYIPEGTFDLTNTVYITNANIVLRGAGPEKTVLRVTNGITGIYLLGDGTQDGKSQIMDFSRGDMVITNSALASNSQVGDLIYATIYLSTAHDIAYSNLLAQCVGGVQIPQFSGSVSCQMYGKVVGISGSRVTLDRPLEFSYQGPTLSGTDKKWGVGILRPLMHDSGVEDMTITYDPNYPYAKHFNGTAPGPANEEDVESHAVYFRGAVNCWARNLLIKEACEGVSSYGGNVQCTVSDITLEATRLSQSEFPLSGITNYDYAMQFDTPLTSNYWDVRGHAAVQLAGSHMLAQRIRLKYAALHDLTINSTVNSVFADVKGFDISLDHHRQNGSRNLWTQIDTGLGRKFWLSSGVNADGIQCGAWETFWNIDSDMNQDFPSWAPTGNAFCRGYINLVGLRTVASVITNANPQWFEANIGPGQIAQPNLFEAMRIKRFAGRGWDSVPPTAVATVNTNQGRGSLTVNFTGSASSDNVGIVSYLWNFGDGYTAWTTNAQHTYTQPGIYTARLVVCDARNLYGTAEVKITVLATNQQYNLAYKLAGSSALWNYAYSNTSPSFTLSGATNQVVAEGGFGTVVAAAPMAGYQFVGWDDGVTRAVRAETNVLESKVLTAYFMPGTATPSGSAPTNLTLSANTVREGATNGTVIGTLTATDPDAGETFLYQLTNDAGGRFVVHPYTGQLLVANSALLNYTNAQSHTITAKVFDSTAQSYTKNFTILVTSASPVADAQSVSVNENTSVGITLTGSDPQGAPLTYTVTTPPANGALSGTAPNLVYTPNADFAGADSFAFRVSNGSQFSVPALVSINVIPASRLNAYSLYLKLDETNTTGMAMDSSANGFHATYNGGMTIANVVTGYYGKALKFDGVGNYLSIPYQAALNTTNFSVSLWFKKDAAATTYQRFVSSDNGASGSGQAGYSVMFDNSSKLRFRVGTGSSWADATTASSPTTGVWHHVAVTYDGTTSRLYLDGVEAATRTTAMAQNTNKQFAVAANNNSVSSPFDGTLDDIRVYNFALGTNEVNALYLGVSTYTLTYLAGTNGTISGPNPQTVNAGASGTAVTAVPSSGHIFVNWSDASTANPRTDTNVTNNLTVTANFAPLARPVIGSGFSVSGGNFNLQFTGTPGGHYRVEYAPALPAPGPWQVVTDIVSLATSPWALSIPVTNSSGLYRVGLMIP